MTLPFDVTETANRIVAPRAHPGSGFPRDVEAAALTMPVSVELVRHLTPQKVDEWLRRHVGWDRPPILDGRAVRGCLVAHRSHAFIFLEEAEADDERRFTLAHELAHFHGHYLAARELAIARLGPRVAEVLDGDRQASHAERLSGVLARCPLGVFRDVLGRVDAGPASMLADRMEAEADAAAFQALAPALMVLQHCPPGRAPTTETIVGTLTAQFGLARNDARHHAPAVLRLYGRTEPSLVDRLRAAAMVASQARSA